MTKIEEIIIDIITGIITTGVTITLFVGLMKLCIWIWCL